jgi:type IV secretory pathway TrbF-like protein
MRFKRPQVRYSATPEPVTPYQAAAQVWDQRIGSPATQGPAILALFSCRLRRTK